MIPRTLSYEERISFVSTEISRIKSKFIDSMGVKASKTWVADKNINARADSVYGRRVNEATASSRGDICWVCDRSVNRSEGWFCLAGKIRRGRGRGQWSRWIFGRGSTRGGPGRGGNSFIPTYHQTNASGNFQNDQWWNNQASLGNYNGKMGDPVSSVQLVRVTDQLDLSPQHEHHDGNGNQKSRSRNPFYGINTYGFMSRTKFKSIIHKN